jgi:hypothetical protein
VSNPFQTPSTSQYMVIFPSVGPLARVMGKMIKDVCSFMIVFACYLIGASLAFNLVFGHQVYTMRDFQHTLQALIALIFGNGDYSQMEEANRTLAPLLYTFHLSTRHYICVCVLNETKSHHLVFYLVIAGILFVNLLIAILTQQYEATEKQAGMQNLLCNERYFILFYSLTDNVIHN